MVAIYLTRKRNQHRGDYQRPLYSIRASRACSAMRVKLSQNWRCLLAQTQTCRLGLSVPPGMSTNDAPALMPIVRTPIGGGPLWDQCVLPFYAQGVVLSLCNMGPLAAARQVLCIHDLNIILAPDSYGRLFQAYYRMMLPLAGAPRGVCCHRIRIFGAHVERISVLPNGKNPRNTRRARACFSLETAAFLLCCERKASSPFRFRARQPRSA